MLIDANYWRKAFKTLGLVMLARVTDGYRLLYTVERLGTNFDPIPYSAVSLQVLRRCC